MKKKSILQRLQTYLNQIFNKLYQMFLVTSKVLIIYQILWDFESHHIILIYILGSESYTVNFDNLHPLTLQGFICPMQNKDYLRCCRWLLNPKLSFIYQQRIIYIITCSDFLIQICTPTYHMKQIYL